MKIFNRSRVGKKKENDRSEVGKRMKIFNRSGVGQKNENFLIGPRWAKKRKFLIGLGWAKKRK